MNEYFALVLYKKMLVTNEKRFKYVGTLRGELVLKHEELIFLAIINNLLQSAYSLDIVF